MSLKLTALCAPVLALTSFGPQPVSKHAAATQNIAAQIQSLKGNLNTCLAGDTKVHQYMHGLMYRSEGVKIKDQNSDGTIDMIGEEGKKYYQKIHNISSVRQDLAYSVQDRAIKIITEKGCEAIYYMPGENTSIQTVSLDK